MQHWLDLNTLAYLDPGTGSYALQLLMAGLFGGMFALRQSWSDVKTWAAARFGRSTDPNLEARRIGPGPSHVAKASHHAQPIADTR